MADLDNLKDKYEGKKEKNLADTIKDMKELTAQLGGKKQSAPVRAAKQAISGFRSQWSGIDEKGDVGIGKGVPGIYYDTVAIPALAGIVDDKYAPEFAVEADKKAGKIREGIRKDMGIEAPRGALEHFANAGGTMLGQLPVPGAWLNRVLSPVKSAGVAGKVATSPIEYLSPIVEPKKINYGVGTGFGGTIGVVGEALEEEPIKKALGGLIQKYETGGKVGKVKSFFSAVDKAIDTLKQKKGTGEQILKEIEKAPGVKKEELELRKISEKLKDKKSITQDEVRALAAQSPAPNIKPIVRGRKVDPSFLENPEYELDLLQLRRAGYTPQINPDGSGIQLVDKDGNIFTPSEVDNTLKDLLNNTTEEIPATQTAGALKSLRALNFDSQENALKNAPKFEKYTTPGGENYREILLQLDKPIAKPGALFGGKPRTVSVQEAADYLGMRPEDFNPQSSVLIYPNGMYVERLNDGTYYGMAYNEDKVSASLEDIEEFLASRVDRDMLDPAIPEYRGGHFDEPNVLVHARVTDRTGPNGEKVLYVEEIQSDWHQTARKYRDNTIDSILRKEEPQLKKQSFEIMESIGRPETNRENAAMREGIMDRLMKERRAELSKEMPKDAGYSVPLTEFRGTSADDLLWEHGDKLNEGQKQWLRDYIERWELDVDGSPAGQSFQEALSQEYDEWLRANTTKGIPNAPFKNTANELAVKQILDMAANEGYDTVAFSPGSEHVKRYGMSQYFDTLIAEKKPNGKINLTGIKNDKSVFDKDVSPDELGDYIGKEKAENIMGQLKRPVPKNEAGDKLSSLIDEWSVKYDEDFPLKLREKLTPEEDTQWDTLLEQSRQWDRENRVQQGDRMVMPKQQAILKGDDLELTSSEGAGKKKIYDEIIPNFVRKYAQKEFGAEPGEIDLPLGKGTGKTYQQYLDEIVEDPYRYIDEDEYYEIVHERVGDRAAYQGYDMDNTQKWEELLSRETDEADQIWAAVENEFYEEKAKELAAKDMGGSLRAFSVPVTPQMREKITGEGQKLFAAAPVVGVQGIPGMEEAPQQAAPEPEPEVEETPMPFQSGGMATPRSELEDDPFVRTVMNAARHYQAGKEIEAGQLGLAKGPVTVGVNAANIIDPGTRDAMQAQSLFAAYRDRLGGVDVNASVNKPIQVPEGFYQGNVMASVPVGPGRAMAGLSGYKSPQKTDISGYNVGYGQKVGPGYASGSVFQPKDRRQDTRYDVQYTIPFQSGGAVGFENGGRVGKTRAAAEKLLRVLHGSPTRITPESGKAIDVTTEPSYAVKRGADKMIGKSGPPMVNQFDIPQGRMLQFEEQYSPEDVALMRRYFNKLPQGQAMRGEEIFDAAQGRDAILEGIAKAGGFAGYERPNTGAVGKGQWFRVTEPEELVRKARGGLAQLSKPL
jgi:uncharacterized protein YidB (DUF937 family)